MKTLHALRLPLTAASLLASFAASTPAAATEPACNEPVPPVPLHWPLYERPGAMDAALFEVDGATPRNFLWNSFGEFQSHTAAEYMHTGIDLNASVQDVGGDFVVNVQNGYIWGTHNLSSAQCSDLSMCKLYVATLDEPPGTGASDHRFRYYYAHLALGAKPNEMTVDHDSQVRAKILNASLAPNENTASLFDCDDADKNSCVAPGKVLSGTNRFDLNQFKFAHLHFAVMDACANYDGLNPLDMYKDFDYGYRDSVPPTVDDVFLVAEDDDANITPAGRCNAVEEDFQIIAKMHDSWKEIPDGNTNNLFSGNNFTGVDMAQYRVVNLSAPGALTPVVWYHFDQIPFRCAGGPLRGNGCLEDPDVKNETISEDEFCEEVSIYPPVAGLAGPFFGRPYTDVLYSNAGSFTSQSKDWVSVPRYHASMTHEWGENIDPISVGALGQGQYQVTVEAFDTEGLAHQKTVFFQSPANPNINTGDLVIRDNPADVGALPSTIGDQKHYRSPNVRVLPANFVGKPAIDDPIWTSPPQVIEVEENEPVKVFVLVENMGCDDITGFSVQVGTTKAALISANWEIIDSQIDEMATTIGKSGDMDDKFVVGPFDWIPSATQVGHRCMLAGVTSTDDPIKDIPMSGGVMNFEDPDVSEPTAFYVPKDSNLAQRNLTVSNAPGTPFLFGNPFNTAIDFSLDIDCNDLPIDAAGAAVTLHLESFPELATGWFGAQQVTINASPFSGAIEMTLEGCKIHLPEVQIPANTEVDAWLEVDLPNTLAGTWTIDLTARIDGEPRDSKYSHRAGSAPEAGRLAEPQRPGLPVEALRRERVLAQRVDVTKPPLQRRGVARRPAATAAVARVDRPRRRLGDPRQRRRQPRQHRRHRGGVVDARVPELLADGPQQRARGRDVHLGAPELQPRHRRRGRHRAGRRSLLAAAGQRGRVVERALGDADGDRGHVGDDVQHRRDEPGPADRRGAGEQVEHILVRHEQALGRDVAAAGAARAEHPPGADHLAGARGKYHPAQRGRPGARAGARLAVQHHHTIAKQQIGALAAAGERPAPGHAITPVDHVRLALDVRAPGEHEVGARVVERVEAGARQQGEHLRRLGADHRGPSGRPVGAREDLEHLEPAAQVELEPAVAARHEHTKHPDVLELRQ